MIRATDQGLEFKCKKARKKLLFSQAPLLVRDRTPSLRYSLQVFPRIRSPSLILKLDFLLKTIACASSVCQGEGLQCSLPTTQRLSQLATRFPNPAFCHAPFVVAICDLSGKFSSLEEFFLLGSEQGETNGENHVRSKRCSIF
jgi:hypothetical protein